ncbi:hypothetical protein, partial [Archangium sp.]|uniref:hypothetical protein n=1 Tax=Archangium sp. TaxID=1872627 RepID=UPI002D341520
MKVVRVVDTELLARVRRAGGAPDVLLERDGPIGLEADRIQISLLVLGVALGRVVRLARSGNVRALRNPFGPPHLGGAIPHVCAPGLTAADD